MNKQSINESSKKIEIDFNYIQQLKDKFQINKVPFKLKNNKFIFSFHDIKNWRPPIDNYLYSTSSTYFIDHENQFVQNIVRLLEKKLKKTKPDYKDIINFTFNIINEKLAIRLFDNASSVAKHLSGDHSEINTLLLSLLRHYKIPSFLSIGYILKEQNKKYVLAKTSWIYSIIDEQIKLIDGLSPIDEFEKSKVLLYLPISFIENENNNYLLSLLKDNLFKVKRFKVL